MLYLGASEIKKNVAIEISILYLFSFKIDYLSANGNLDISAIFNLLELKLLVY